MTSEPKYEYKSINLSKKFSVYTVIANIDNQNPHHINDYYLWTTVSAFFIRKFNKFDYGNDANM